MDDPLIGQRIELLAMPDDPAPVEIGDTGTIRSVTEIQGTRQIGVDWDSGRMLALVIPPDRYRIIESKGQPSWES